MTLTLLIGQNPGLVRPVLGDVGAILRARTRSDVTGNELGTFDDTTRPTGEAVESFLDIALTEVVLRLPDELPAKFENFVKRLVSLRAAMFVELSYDPDRIGDGSAYDRLAEQFDAGMTALLAGLDDAGADTSTAGRLIVADLVSPYSGPATRSVFDEITN